MKFRSGITSMPANRCPIMQHNASARPINKCEIQGPFHFILPTNWRTTFPISLSKCTGSGARHRNTSLFYWNELVCLKSDREIGSASKAPGWKCSGAAQRDNDKTTTPDERDLYMGKPRCQFDAPHSIDIGSRLSSRFIECHTSCSRLIKSYGDLLDCRGYLLSDR